MKIGWNMVIETTKGTVELWTSFLGDGLGIFYPLDVAVSDEMVMDTLNVTRAKPVADKLNGTHLWAKFYSDRLKDDYGRVWIMKDSHYFFSYDFETIQNKQIVVHQCGNSRNNVIATYYASYCSETEPDAPNSREMHIHPYLNKFVQLLVKIAKLTGNIVAVNVSTVFDDFNPIIQHTKGYRIEMWKSDDIEFCYTQKDSYEIMLKRVSPYLPWSTVIRYPATNAVTAEALLKFVENLTIDNIPATLSI